MRIARIGGRLTAPFERGDQPTPPGERPPDVGWQLALGGFFRALDIPLLGGRLFDASDGPAGRPVVIVSHAIEERFFPGESAVGRQIRLGQGIAEIVSVVGDIRRAGLNDSPRADMYFRFERNVPGRSRCSCARRIRAPRRPRSARRCVGSNRTRHSWRRK